MTADYGELANHVSSAVSAAAAEPRITVYGCGGAGTNILNGLRGCGLDGIERVAVNTDAEHLARADADHRILVGERLTGGNGAGGRPQMGQLAAEADRHRLRDGMRGDIVFLVAGLGGGTGTGVTPVLAAVAKEAGAVSIAIAVMPFAVEGRHDVAERGLDRLRDLADATLVIHNDMVRELVGNLPLHEGFAVVTEAVAQIVATTATRVADAFLGQVDEEVLEVTRQAVDAPAGPEAPLVVTPPASVQAAAEIAPVAFDDGGFLDRA